MRRLLRSGNANEHVGQGHVRAGLPKTGYAPAPFGMNDIVGDGKRLVVRVVLLQTGCAALAALLFWIYQGAAAGRAGLAGGLIVAVGTALFGWRLFAPGIAPAGTLRRALFAAGALKWCWYGLGLWAALTRLKYPPLPLMGGLVIAQFGYWAGLVGKRG